MNRDRHPHNRPVAEYQKIKFFKHLKMYLCFIGFMLFVNVFLGSDANFYPVAFWWGFGVVIHYLRTFGWSGLTEQGAQQPKKAQRYESFPEPEVEELVELRQPQKSWRDRDLV